jgi:Domain of unknown function (DUF4865)
MYAKQYELPLPADYDMGIIRKRVAGALHVLDGRAGLGLKAYVIRERGVDGSPVNEYAPFYLWNDTREMARFLVGGAGYERIIRSFGRAGVRHWTGIATFAGPARDTTPRTASRRLTVLPTDPDPEDTGLALSGRIEREIEELGTLAQRGDVHTAALAVDPGTWQLVRFVLWEGAVPAGHDATERYEVLHLTAPDLAALPHGRAWDTRSA